MLLTGRAAGHHVLDFDAMKGYLAFYFPQRRLEIRSNTGIQGVVAKDQVDWMLGLQCHLIQLHKHSALCRGCLLRWKKDVLCFSIKISSHQRRCGCVGRCARGGNAGNAAVGQGKRRLLAGQAVVAVQLLQWMMVWHGEQGPQRRFRGQFIQIQLVSTQHHPIQLPSTVQLCLFVKWSKVCLFE